MRNKKTIISIVVLALILVSVPVGVYLVRQRQEIRKRAAANTTLTLRPTPAENLEVFPGDEFSLGVWIDTGENFVASADVSINFDASLLAAEEIIQGSFLDVPLPAGIQISSGKVRFTYQTNPAKQSSGEENLATIRFNVLDNANPGPTGIITEVRIVSPPDSIVATVEGGLTSNALQAVNPTTIRILPVSPGVTPTITPTITPPPEETPTVTPTETPEPGETPTVTPTEAPPPGNTPTPTPTSPPSSGVTPTPTPVELPVSGDLTPTMVTVTGGGLLIILGFLALLLI